MVFSAVVILSACRPGAQASCELQDLAIDAASGDPVAQYNLAVEFYTGKRIARDYARAAVLWRQSAARGNTTAKSNLGFLTYHGWGVRADPALAVRLLTEAAASGESDANYHLGVASLEGKGTEPDRAEAYARFRAAELMADTADDDVGARIAMDARAELRKLEPILLSDERRTGEARARTYASVRRARHPRA